ncbi:MAG: Tetratricopeptide 1 repeat-containing protein [Acidobacteria bacterium]|jgi:tetratricopeptide (TPR) repeat protein|nr:Tetratricopeptide 1 repeat-containing protein [Acidobacteriota bacterium]
MMPPHDQPRRVGCRLLLLVALISGCNSGSRQLKDRAETDWRKGKYSEAIQANEELYRLEPRGRYAPGALLSIAEILYLNQRQLKQAIEFYDKLTQEFPDSPETMKARKQLAGIYANEVVDLNQAILQYDKILQARDLEDRPEILFLRADAYFKQGEYYRALRELIHLEESGVSGHLADQVELKIGNIYQVQKKFSESIAPFRKVIAASCPECRRRAVLSLTETYENLLDIDKAIETIRLLDDTPENTQMIESEVARLNRSRKAVETGAGLELKYPRPAEPPAKTATRKKRAASPTKSAKK